MFVFSNWEKICNELSFSFKCIRADEIIEQDGGGKWIVVKHDVETNVSKALKLAKIENKYGIKLGQTRRGRPGLKKEEVVKI